MGHHHKKSSRRDYPPEPMQNPNPPNPLGNIDIGSIANLLGSLDLSRLTSLLGNIDMGQVSSMLSKMNQSPQSNPKPAPPQEGSFSNPNSNTGNNDNNNNPLGNINTNDLNNMLKNIDMNQVSSMVSQMTGGGGLGGLPLDMGKPKAGDYRIGVLNSLKPFLPEDKCNMIDEIVKYLTLKTAIDKVKGSKSKG